MLSEKVTRFQYWQTQIRIVGDRQSHSRMEAVTEELLFFFELSP